MFLKKETQVDFAVNKAFRTLNSHEPESPEYAKILDQIVKLHKMQMEETSKFVSKDTLALIGANLAGLLMVIKHENVNVITSRAMGLLLKPR